MYNEIKWIFLSICCKYDVYWVWLNVFLNYENLEVFWLDNGRFNLFLNIIVNMLFASYDLVLCIFNVDYHGVLEKSIKQSKTR